MVPTLHHRDRFPLAGRNRFKRYFIALLSTAVALGGRYLSEKYFGYALSPFSFFYPAVAVATWYGGLIPGILTTALSMLGAAFIFTSSYNFTPITESWQLIQLLLFVFMSLIMCFLMQNLYKSILNQNQTARELIQFQNKVTNILESIRGCFFNLDEEGRFVHINEDCKNYFPAPREGLYGKSIWDVMERWKGTILETNLKKVVEKKEAIEFEFEDASRNQWFEVHISPAIDGASVHLYDITSRKDTEDALVESEKRFRLIADQAPVMAWMTGLDALFVYFNRPWLSFRGRTLEQELGNGWVEGIHPDDRQSFLDTYLKAFHAREGFRMEYRLKNVTHHYRWVLDTGVPRFTLENEFLGFIGSAIDITDRKELEQRRSMEHKITQVLSGAGEASPGETLIKIIQTICEEFKWQVGLYWEVEAHSTNLTCKGFWNRPGFSCTGFLSQSREISFAQGVGLPGRVWALAKAFWIPNVAQDPNFPRAKIATSEGLMSGVAFPLRLDQETFGVIEFFSTETQEPNYDLLQTLESLGSEIGQYMERKYTEEALKAAYDEMEKRVEKRTAQLGQINETLMEEIKERKKVEREVLEISEKEQRRLGAQIHDDLCQSLTGIMIITKVLTQKMERRELPEFLELKKIGILMDQSITQAREMARGFYPVELEANSMMIALNDLANRTETFYNIKCRFVCPQRILIEDNNIATHLYRIAQEAIHNSVKHGNAKNIDINLIQEKNKITLGVNDDGTGMPSDPSEKHGIGLHIMKYRARMIDATLQTIQLADGGMSLVCSFPYPSQKDAQYA